MKGIIIFESLHGSTGKCASILSDITGGKLKLNRLQENEDIRLEEYDTVIIGGSIHHGMIQMRIEKFMEKYREQLLSKKLGLYLCCIEEGENARNQFEKAYPVELREKAAASGLFGGELKLRKMNLFERQFTRKVAGIKKSVSKINVEAIHKFAKDLSLKDQI